MDSPVRAAGFCLTAVERRTEREILDAFGVTAASVELLTMAEADAEFGTELPVIRAGVSGALGFAFENFGTLGSDGEDGTPDLTRVDPTVAALELATLVCGLRLAEDAMTGPPVHRARSASGGGSRRCSTTTGRRRVVRAW